MTAYVIEVYSRSEKPINKLTGGPWESFGVYSKKELQRRLAELRRDPDLQVTWRQVDEKTIAAALAAARKQGLIP